VDSVARSSLSNLKELRPGASEVRILCVFDPDRQAVFLVAGDKAGRWSNWYSSAIKEAEEAYATYLDERSAEC